MKSFYSFMEVFLRDCGHFLMRKSLWFLYPSLFFLFFDFLAYLKEGKTTQISISDLFTIFNINYFYYAEISGIQLTITGWIMIDKFINYIFTTNIGVSLFIFFIIFLILGFLLWLLGGYCFDKHTEIIWEENKKP